MGLFGGGFDIEKSIEISVPKEKVWEYITDGEKKSIWSPWFILEGDCEQNFEGKVGQVGYKETWEGKVVGKGEQIIREIKKNEFIKSDITFIKPYSAKNKIEFLLSEKDGVSTLTWKMNANIPLYMIFFKKHMKAFISQDFERGLVMLKSLLETGKLLTRTVFEGKADVDKKYFIALSGKGTLQEIGPSMANDFVELGKILTKRGIESTGYFTLYDHSDMINDSYEYRACAEISQEDYGNCLIDTKFNYDVSVFNGGEYLQTTHEGAYKFLGNSWTGSFMYARAGHIHIAPKHTSMEVYEKGPLNEENEDNYITHIFLPMH